MSTAIPLLLASLATWAPKQSIVEGRVAVDAQTLNSVPTVDLPGEWRFHPGDRREWADPGFDDSGWRFLDPSLGHGVPDDWSGIGWFRLRIAIGHDLVNRELALWLLRLGAVEVFIDGEKVGGFGDPDAVLAGDKPEVSIDRSPVVARFRRPEALVAIRFAAPPAIVKWLAGQGTPCAASIGLASNIPAREVHSRRVMQLYWFFIGVSFALGLLHFLLFVFLPTRKENLQYALVTWAMGGLSLFIATRAVTVSTEYFLIASTAFKVCVLAVSVFGVKFYHAVLGDPPRPLFKAYVILGVVTAFAAFWVPFWGIYLYAVYGVFEQVRLTTVANMRGLRDAWLLAAGVAMSGVGALIQMLPELVGMPPLIDDAYLFGFLGMLIMLSAYQARGFAHTYRDLQHRLDDVRRLSEERVEQARRVRSEEMQRVRLEEENKRQAVELKEAARRQEVLGQLEAAHRELKDTQAQLVQSEKMASLGQLVAGIAHEINTPVGAISSVHDSLSKATVKLKAALDQDHPGLIEDNRRIKASLKVIEDANGVIESGSGRVAKIVRRLKSFARLDEAELLVADVHEGLDDTLVLLHHELKRDIKVHRHYGAVAPFPCYPSQLNQVFLNLLVNARQAIEGPGEIFISTEVVDGKAHIAIRDTGKGIPKANQGRVFDPGFTTKGVKVGTGLGLSICYRIITEHRGQILVQSEQGQGATFTVVLPMDLDRQLEREREGS